MAVWCGRYNQDTVEGKGIILFLLSTASVRGIIDKAHTVKCSGID